MGWARAMTCKRYDTRARARGRPRRRPETALREFSRTASCARFITRRRRTGYSSSLTVARSPRARRRARARAFTRRPRPRPSRASSIRRPRATPRRGADSRGQGRRRAERHAGVSDDAPSYATRPPKTLTNAVTALVSSTRPQPCHREELHRGHAPRGASALASRLARILILDSSESRSTDRSPPRSRSPLSPIAIAMNRDADRPSLPPRPARRAAPRRHVTIKSIRNRKKPC